MSCNLGPIQLTAIKCEHIKMTSIRVVWNTFFTSKNTILSKCLFHVQNVFVHLIKCKIFSAIMLFCFGGLKISPWIHPRVFLRYYLFLLFLSPYKYGVVPRGFRHGLRYSYSIQSVVMAFLQAKGAPHVEPAGSPFFLRHPPPIDSPKWERSIRVGGGDLEATLVQFIVRQTDQRVAYEGFPTNGCRAEGLKKIGDGWVVAYKWGFWYLCMGGLKLAVFSSSFSGCRILAPPPPRAEVAQKGPGRGGGGSCHHRPPGDREPVDGDQRLPGRRVMFMGMIALLRIYAASFLCGIFLVTCFISASQFLY